MMLKAYQVSGRRGGNDLPAWGENIFGLGFLQDYSENPLKTDYNFFSCTCRQ